jgi:hypothetical protein
VALVVFAAAAFALRAVPFELLHALRRGSGSGSAPPTP